MLEWFVFIALIGVMLVIDLGIAHKTSKEISVREALKWSAIWVAISLAFNAGIYLFLGKEPALQFLSGYVIEKSLSVDNIFVFFLLFTHFKLSVKYQYKVLMWGILGAIILRGLMIAVGVTLIERLHWFIYILSVFLVYTGLRMVVQKAKAIDPEKMIGIRLLKKWAPVNPVYYNDRFFVKINGTHRATLLFLVLVAVEFTDLVFAMDSVPAVLAISTDPFIVYTSNIFAILGLRSLFFAVTGIVERLKYLKIGLCIVLVFIGVKLFLHDLYKIPTGTALGIIFLILAASVGWSLWATRRKVQTSQII
jgi:tellurite resistance protein TerC